MPTDSTALSRGKTEYIRPRRQTNKKLDSFFTIELFCALCRRFWHGYCFMNERCRL